IRNKLILLLAGPLVITLLLSALGARDRKASAAESSRVERLVNASRANSDVVDALQGEALASAAFVGSGRARWDDELAAARKAADEALSVALPRLDGIAGSSAAVGSAVGLAKGAAEKLAFYRDSVDQGFRADQLSELVVNYGQLEDTFLAVNANVTETVDDPQAAADLRGAAALAAYKAAIATQGALLAGAAEVGRFDEKAFDTFEKAVAQEQRTLDLLNSITGLQRKGSVRDAMATQAATAFELLRDQALKVGAGAQLGFTGEEVTAAATTVTTDLHEVEANLFASLASSAADASEGAARAANLFLVAALVAIGAAVVAALFLGRRITGPLRKLTEAADRLSGEQMPRLIETLKNPVGDDLGFIGGFRPIEIGSHDEIGRLAHSFNEVQRVASEVAEEQAQLLRKGIGEMFVNLARRNQALLDRQIEFIDELERGEEDPDQLDNLYRLDHLATRMRRNA
ncbi:MAG: nitrate- and nitrite sensing domain-containing protein, partial [Acidimicrobiales bacterium]|nr:nitrate- and nitrite sensing domain-containing protein [Acidimicrobiales bacterium]